MSLQLYFKDTDDIIIRGINDMNYRMTIGMDMYIGLSELISEYPEIKKSLVVTGFDGITSGNLDDFGWNVVDTGLLKVHRVAYDMNDGKPWYKLSAPIREYNRL